MEKTLKEFFILLFLFILLGPVLASEEDEPVEISYVELKPSIVSNLTGGPKYIRCDIQLMTEQASAVYDIELHMPAIRHTILMLIANQDGNHLKSRKGKKELRTKALESVKNVLEEITGKPLVKDLYFTAYYVK